MRGLGATTVVLVLSASSAAASEAQLCHNLRLDPPMRIEACTRAMMNANAALSTQVDLLSARAMAFDDLGDYGRAIQDYDSAIVLAPGDPYLHLNRGVAKIHGGRPADAIADYDRASQLKPDWHLPYFNRAVALDELGQRAAALADFERAIERKPTDPWIYVGQGDVLRGSGKPVEAVAAYEKALALRPDLDDARAKRATLLLQTRPAEALAELDDVLTRHPSRANLWTARAEAKFQLALYADAAMDLRQSLTLAPDKDVRRKVVRAELAGGNSSAAWDAIAPTLDGSNPGPDAADLAMAARVALQKGEAAAALDLAQRAAALKPGDAEIEALRAIALRHLGRTEEAKVAAQQAWLFSPRSQEIGAIATQIGFPTPSQDAGPVGTTPAQTDWASCIKALEAGDRVAAQAAGAKWSLCHLAASF